MMLITHLIVLACCACDKHVIMYDCHLIVLAGRKHDGLPPSCPKPHWRRHPWFLTFKYIIYINFVHILFTQKVGLKWPKLNAFLARSLLGPIFLFCFACFPTIFYAQRVLWQNKNGVIPSSYINLSIYVWWWDLWNKGTMCGVVKILIAQVILIRHHPWWFSTIKYIESFSSKLEIWFVIKHYKYVY